VVNLDDLVDVEGEAKQGGRRRGWSRGGAWEGRGGVAWLGREARRTEAVSGAAAREAAEGRVGKQPRG
jgi:hypothetical protein